MAQITHLRRCVECKRSQSAARLACEDLEKVKGQVEELLWKRLPSDTDQAKRDMQRYMKQGFIQDFRLGGENSLYINKVRDWGHSSPRKKFEIWPHY